MFRSIKLKIHWPWLLLLPVWFLPGMLIHSDGLLEGFTNALFLAAVVTVLGLIPHEYGHALASYVFGVRNGTIHVAGLAGGWLPDENEWSQLRLWQRNVIAAAGPVANFFGYVVCVILLRQFGSEMPYTLFRIIKVAEIVNIYMAVVNLLPIFPLDGGRLLHALLHCTKLSPIRIGRILFLVTFLIGGWRLLHLFGLRNWYGMFEVMVLASISLGIISQYDFENEVEWYSDGNDSELSVGEYIYQDQIRKERQLIS